MTRHQSPTTPRPVSRPPPDAPPRRPRSPALPRRIHRLRHNRRMENLDVAVIGAGVAGPAAADALRRKGFAVEVEGEAWEADNGRLRPAESQWDHIDRLLKKIDTSGPDLSFADFLARRPRGKSLAQAREEACFFVQGFHAADIEQISVHSLAG